MTTILRWYGKPVDFTIDEITFKLKHFYRFSIFLILKYITLKICFKNYWIGKNNKRHSGIRIEI